MTEIKDTGVLAAMLDEAEGFLKNADPNSPLSNEKAAKLINQITDKAAELIEEAFETPSLSFQVALPNRYYSVIEALDSFGK
ncbi:MAG: hypothetical protein LUC92_09530 [Clostridiales bacterium]|nr:hypothetical protein [Clostridiales bacterium]